MYGQNPQELFQSVQAISDSPSDGERNQCRPSACDVPDLRRKLKSEAGSAPCLRVFRQGAGNTEEESLSRYSMKMIDLLTFGRLTMGLSMKNEVEQIVARWGSQAKVLCSWRPSTPVPVRPGRGRL